MDMTADVVILRHRIYDLVTDVFRMGCGESHAEERTDLGHLGKKVREVSDI